jgi:beta-phosphoglucomutase-like phosphatase (HAD superfamily)
MIKALLLDLDGTLLDDAAAMTIAAKAFYQAHHDRLAGMGFPEFALRWYRL